MLDKGYEPLEIARRLKCDVQRVHTVRYLDRKKAGIGALVTETPAPIPVVGVATPKKRGRPRKVVIPTLQQDSSSREKSVLAEVTPAQRVHAAHPTVIYTKPTMVQRVREWFASWR
jgi:hypothetical protein